ncbi:hypothetical protein BD310DRAFT_937414 [Dichomitus squalens]|uniref:Uncharacterized protein n=1 Tax=Dichomitus squalens TaxID=114155 RepID=A0A4Q9PI81_9APHY|nr:hypothetical protein BD310DRAFT_937414 [Dichomitus squalens]
MLTRRPCCLEASTRSKAHREVSHKRRLDEVKPSQLNTREHVRLKTMASRIHRLSTSSRNMRPREAFSDQFLLQVSGCLVIRVHQGATCDLIGKRRP